MNTIIGIVVAIVIMLVGLIMILRKPKPVEPSLDSALQINPESNQPIIPRHVRDQLVQTNQQVAATRVEPSLNLDAAEQSTSTVDATTSVIEEQQSVEVNHSLSSDAKNQKSEFDEASGNESQSDRVNQTVETQVAAAPQIETVEVAEFDGESNLLDVHLHQQRRSDDESSLATAEQIVALNVYANPRRALSGDNVLKILTKYGLRFGEMSCFHRYEHTDQPSTLMFSVLRITDHGPAGFDLESLSGEQIQGLAFFLALPNSKALTGYDMMTSTAGLIAREIDGMMFDAENLEFTPKQKEHWRHYVMDYCSNRTATS